MIKAIIFDCFGVLTKDWWREFCDSLPEGPGLEKAKELNHQYDAGLISLPDFVNEVQRATGREQQQLEDIFTTPEPAKNTQLMDYLKILKPDYKIGMLSNIGTNWVTEHFLTADEQKLFDALVFSYQVGTTKPDPKIYRFTAEKLGVEPEQCVFIDDIQGYAQAAQAVGMQAIHYEDFAQMKGQLELILADNPAANN